MKSALISLLLASISIPAHAGIYDGNWNLIRGACDGGKNFQIPLTEGPGTIDSMLLAINGTQSTWTMQMTLVIQNMDTTVCRRAQPQTMVFAGGNVTITPGTPVCTTVAGNSMICSSMCRGTPGPVVSEPATVSVSGDVMKVKRVENKPNGFCPVGETEELEFHK